MCTPDNTQTSELAEKIMRTTIINLRTENAIVIRLHAVETEDSYIYQHEREADAEYAPYEFLDPVLPSSLAELTVARVLDAFKDAKCRPYGIADRHFIALPQFDHADTPHCRRSPDTFSHTR